MSENIFADIIIPLPWRLDISAMQKGIDNYHVDVRLSKRFSSDLKVLITELIRRETEGKKFQGDPGKVFTPICRSYQDMMTVLIHRVKTDMTVDEISFLQFAVVKHILYSVTRSLNDLITETKRQAADLRSQGSMNVLKVQHQLAWMNKHYNTILYSIKKQIFEHLHRTEYRQLRALREQYLGDTAINFLDFLSNMVMMCRDLNSPRYLIEHYINWGGDFEESEFPAFNASLEALMLKELPELETYPLKSIPQELNEPLEVYDDLKMLRPLQYYLGPVVNMREQVWENFSWLESSSAINFLFQTDKLRENIPQIKQNHDRKTARAYTKQIARLEKTLKKIGAQLKKNKFLRQCLASYQTRKIWSSAFNEEIDPKLLCQYLAGQISIKRLQDVTLGGKQLSDDEEAVLKDSLKEIGTLASKNLNDQLVAILTDFSRFRLHLKYTRFAHRIFNRMAVLTTAGDIELSKQAQTLFQLPCADEIEDDEARIVHHTVMKADVRGSTVVTEMLEKKSLNPASYFSLHFFNPINEIIPLYGGAKVFIEGDAIILSFLEYEHSPQQWFSVARACGLARSILKIVHANNQFARQSELPMLELGIGICFSNEAPRYLFDGDSPIMISSAIGLADRLSSCSWKLREKMQSRIFSVEVLAYAEEERDKGEKGQQLIRYNVNGILLENAAFEKLQREVKLSKISASFDGKAENLYYGIYSDLEGNRHDIVIREGRVGIWSDETITAGEESADPYYEVVTNGKVISMLRDKLRT